jgi:hypothetical protein
MIVDFRFGNSEIRKLDKWFVQLEISEFPNRYSTIVEIFEIPMRS